jgi:hypothetical protein
MTRWRVHLRSVATRSRALTIACASLAYVATIGSIVSSHVGSGSFAAFGSMVPLSVAALAAVVYASVLHNAAVAPGTHRKFVASARCIAAAAVAAVAWSLADLARPIVGMHASSLIRDGAVVLTIFAYAAVPRSLAEGTRLDDSDTFEMRIALISYVCVSGCIFVVLPLAIPGGKAVVAACVVHFAVSGFAFMTSVRLRSIIDACIPYTIGAAANCASAIAVVIAARSSGIGVAAVVAWVLEVHALVLMFAPIVRMGMQLVSAGGRTS